MFTIRLFGALELWSDDQILAGLASSRAESLLAYLILHRDVPQPRQRLAYMLWPDSSESQARTNLRHVLHDLRRALPGADRFLEVTPRTLRWRPDAPFWLDVAAFDDALARAAGREAEGELEALREAAALYRGDLLDGDYDDWLLPERDRLRGEYLAVLERLAALLAARGAASEAIGYAERLCRDDPLNEAGYRLMMRLHAARGQPARALQTYHLCSATLERELGIEPSRETRQIYEELLPGPREHDVPDATPRVASASGSALVGRMAEWTRLTTLWRETEGNRAQVVLVSGEPGAGKTRLVDELRRWVERRRALTASARSYAAEGAMAYGPLVAWLRSPVFAPHLNQLDRVSRAELGVLLADMFPAGERGVTPDTLAEDGRQRLFAAAARAIHAGGGPVLLVADDLQWCDIETLRFLHYLLRVDPEFPLLVAATARQEEIGHDNPLRTLVASLRALERFTEIELGRLTEEETALLAARLDGQPLPEAVAARLFRETEGNPLFVVEAIRAGWDGRGDAFQLTPKVQAVIEDRLAQLSAPARDLVGLAATIGREFSPELLAAAGEFAEENLVRCLDELWRRRIIRELGSAAYDFSHDKIREVTYLGLGPVLHHHLHLRVARALVQLHGHDPRPVSGQIAAHYEQAGAIDQAVTWYERAAEVALHLHASVEAVRLLSRALDLIGNLPATPERRERELAILTTLQVPLGVVEGWASERLAALQERGLALADELGVEPAPLLRSMAVASLSRRDFAAARRFGERLRARGEGDTDDTLLVEGDYVLGITAFWQGEFPAARRHFASAVERYRPEHRSTHLLSYGADPKVICLSRLGNTLWFLGYLEAAVEARHAALALADEIEHPYSQATALVFAALLALEMRDEEGVRGYAAKLKAEHAKHGMRPNDVATEHYGGYIDVLDGRAAVGIARIQRTLRESLKGDHAPGMRAFSVRVLLEACAVAGDTRTGLETADWALGLDGFHGIWEAETHRLRAGFQMALGAPANDVEAGLARALEIARHQGAKMLELRAASGLLRYRLARRDPAIDQAREQLASIVASLPEGRDIPDLRGAAALLG